MRWGWVGDGGDRDNCLQEQVRNYTWKEKFCKRVNIGNAVFNKIDFGEYMIIDLEKMKPN